MLNASVDGDSIVYHEDINVGVAVALERGLIVPVVKERRSADARGNCASASRISRRAHAASICTPEDVAGGTFTVTNPGAFGSLLGTPIINQPQVAILGVGSIEKRPVVVGDALVARDDGDADARLRSPHHRRRRGRPVHGARHTRARELG